MNTPFDPAEPKRPGLLSRLRGSFLTGLVVIAPVGVTLWLIWTVVGWIDSWVLPWIPNSWQPDKLVQNWFGLEEEVQIDVRGIGVVIFLLFTILIGWMAKGFIGRSMIRFAEGLVERTPVVRSIYSGIKQISETVFAQSDRNFEKACLIQYPRKGIWAIGFVSTTAKGEVSAKADTNGALMSVFVPTTPNPTSGFLLFFPKEDVIELEMTVEDAAKLVISAGLVYPNAKDPSTPPDA